MLPPLIEPLSEDRPSGAGGMLRLPSWLPLPEFTQQTLLGEGAGVGLEGQCVLPARAQVRCTFTVHVTAAYSGLYGTRSVSRLVAHPQHCQSSGNSLVKSASSV